MTIHYVSFMDANDVFSSVAKLQNLDDARKVFVVYCDHLHYNGWKMVNCDVFNLLLHEEASEFLKGGVTKYVVLDIIKE